ncbi:MAG: hypothetical protein HRF47_13780 [Chloroflexota bacterium]|jgi:hypothetical protein
MKRSNPPQTKAEFIARYPDPAFPGVSVYACALLIQSGDLTYAVGETSAWVWEQLRRRPQVKVLAVLYAGNDRNAALDAARDYNVASAKKAPEVAA